MKKVRKIVAAAMVCVSVGVVALLVGCVGQAAQDSVSPAGGKAPSYQELTSLFPAEFNSSQVHKTDDEGEDNSHAGFQALMETAAIRDVSGAIITEVAEDDPEKTDVALKCVACKSSKFVDLYNEHGMAAWTDMILDEESMSVIDGQYADCYSCHTWENGEMKLQANNIFAREDILPNTGKFFASLNPEEAACGQCHNTVSARSYLQTEDDLKTYDPYRYGVDFEDRYKAMVEDGMYTVDEATGIKKVTMNHPQVEMYQDSIHQSMGLTCVDCHMNEATDGSGATYRSHDASSAPSEDDSAMEMCLDCHGGQDGIGSVEDMRSFLAEKQDAQAARQAEIGVYLETLYQQILAGVQSGNVEPTALEQAKEKYSLANWLIAEQQQNLFDAADGAQIAHNPELMRNMLERANILIEEGTAMLA